MPVNALASLILLMASATFVLPAVADVEEEDTQARPLRPNVPSDFDAGSRGLSATTIISPELGFAFHPPAASIMVPQRSEGRLVLTILERENPPSWTLSIQHVIARSPDVTAESHIRNHLDALDAAARPHRVIANDAVHFAGSEGRLCYIEQESAQREPYITGWLILPMGDELFLIFSLVAEVEDFPILRERLEAAFATLNLQSTEEVAAERLNSIDAGRAFLRELNRENLRALAGLNQFARIYRPDPAGEGEVEIGFSQLEVFTGRRGELNPDRPESTYSPKERMEGIFVRISGMVIGDVERNLFFDSVATYWMDWDQSEETWTVVGTQRQGRASRSEVETGVRSPPSAESPAMVRAIRDNSSTQLRDTHEWVQPDVYLSQALAPVLARLLPMDTPEPQEYAWYFYNYSQATPQLTRRLDRWESAGDGSGNWVLTSRISVDAPPVRSIYAADRTLIRTVRADGVVTEPITPEELARIWQRKGLPLDRSRVRK